VSLSAVCVTAAAASLAKVTGAGAFPLKVSCSNRTKENENYLGMVAQQGVLAVESFDLPFEQLAKVVWTGILNAYRSSRYDWFPLEELARSIDGGTPAIDHWVNFVEVDPSLSGRYRGRDMAAVADGLADGEYVCADAPPVPFTTVRFGFVVVADEDNLYLRIFGDRLFLPVPSMRAVLETTHDILRTAGRDSE
jgi:hypothetical protein